MLRKKGNAAKHYTRVPEPSGFFTEIRAAQPSDDPHTPVQGTYCTESHANLFLDLPKGSMTRTSALPCFIYFSKQAKRAPSERDFYYSARL